MALSAKTVRARISLLQPLMKNLSLETIRKGQNRLGEMLESKYRKQVLMKEHPFSRFPAAWILPRDERREGVILYLHGGGYVAGDLEYANSIGAFLAVRTGTRVLAPAYRLAPEHPYPAALEDALESYRYLLQKGYAPEHIALCGESAGGGLCYSLCLKLKQENLPQPGCIAAISPWTDLGCIGESYGENEKLDVSMTKEQLEYFSGLYAAPAEEPLASPVYGDLSELPPSLIFVGAEEVMRSDAERLHQRLRECGVSSTLLIRENRWHAYLVYGLEEDNDQMDSLNGFLSEHMCPENKLRWMPLDNTAKIYPAAQSQTWSNVFRVSATLTEPVDVAILQSALDVTVRRFPSMAVRLRRGFFWYYLEQLEHAPEIRRENSYPLARMSRKETRTCAFRVIAYERRIAVEQFHSITDGNGGLVFLKSLVAEYLQQRYARRIPAEKGVLGRLEEPSPEEMEDSFLKYSGSVPASRKANDAWRIPGTPEPDGFLNLTCLEMPVGLLVEKARARGVTLTTFLAAAVMMGLQNMQREKVPNPARRKHIKVLIPVNLRKLFPSRSLRNFILYTTPEIDPRLGNYSFEELCKVIHHHMGLEVTAKRMQMLIAVNVNSERSPFIKLVPLFLKNLVMKAVYAAVGERKSCLSLSNLGAAGLPEEMGQYVERLDFILGVQNTTHYNCGVISYGDTLRMNFTRNIRESELEYHVYRVLRELGVPVTVDSNRQ